MNEKMLNQALPEGVNKFVIDADVDSAFIYKVPKGNKYDEKPDFIVFGIKDGFIWADAYIGTTIQECEFWFEIETLKFKNFKTNLFKTIRVLNFIKRVIKSNKDHHIDKGETNGFGSSKQKIHL